MKPWLNIVPHAQNKKLGYFFPFEIMFDTDLFKKSHLWIAQKMGQNWSSLLDDLAELKYVKKNYKININHLSNMNQLSYLRIWVMLHWYWSLCFQYISNSPLNYNECCVLSSCLFFDNDLKKKISEKKVDFYSESKKWPRRIPKIKTITKKTINKMRSYFKNDYKFELNIILTDKSKMIKLNKIYKNKS